MASYHGSSVYAGCEYVTLESRKAEALPAGTNSNTFTWKLDKLINNHFQSNERGGLCTVQCTGGVGYVSSAYKTVDFQWSDGTINASNVSRTDHPLLAVGPSTHQESSTALNVLDIRGVGEFIVPARPLQLSLEVIVNGADPQSNPFYFSRSNGGVFSLNLKFTYYDPITSTYDEKHRLNYKTL